MRWQLGGNLEPVRIICETDWRQCPRAILKYIWTEVVTDVVDCLITEEAVWRTIAILIAGMILLRMVYAKRKCGNKPMPSEETLDRVGCKVEDLELKINILTYKLQYGTWPLPHQIRSPALKKQLRNLRLTLSTSTDRNAWIKRMLLSSTPEICRSTQSKLDLTSVPRMTDIFHAKMGYFSSGINRDVTPATEYSDVKSSKTTSAESLCLRNDPKNSDQRGLSKSENLGKLRRTSTQLSLLPQNDSWKKAQKQKRSKFSTSQSRLLAPCDRYTESLRECKRFLQELKDSNKELKLEYDSSSILSNDDSTIEKETYPDEKSSLHAQTTDARTASRRCEYNGGIKRLPAKVECTEKNFETIMDRKTSVRETPNDVPQAYYGITSNGLMPSLNSTGHGNSTENFPIEPSTDAIVIPPGDNVIQMSRKTLYRIKEKLESLDNVLRAYGMLNSRVRSVEEAKENGNDVRAIYRNVIDTLDNMKVEIESSNETRKNEVPFDSNPKKYCNKLVQTTGSERGLSKRSDEGSSISMKKESLSTVTKRNQQAVEESNETNAAFTWPRCNRNDLILNHEPVINHSEEQNASSYSKISPTYVKTFSDSSTREIILTRGGMENLSHFPIPMETDEDPSITSSEHEISKGSDLESESTALLLREALECKKELLSRVKLHKFYSNIEFGQDNESNYKNDNDTFYPDAEGIFPSKFLDVIAEERSVSSCTDKTSKTYIFLRMKQQTGELSDDRSLSSLNVDLNDSKQEGPIKELSKSTIPVASSRYFSLHDFAIDRILSNDRSDVLHDFREVPNIILEEIPTDKDEFLGEKEAITSTESLRGKKRHKGIATCDDTDDNRKKLCHRVNLEDRSTPLHRATSGQESYQIKKRSDAKKYSGSVSNISNINEILRENITDRIELFSELQSSTIIKGNKQIFVETDDLSWNQTIESSSSGSIAHRFTIDNGNMTNLLSTTDSNVEIIKYPVIARNDNDETLCGHNFSLKRRPGTFSFAHLKMNTVIPKDGDLFIRNPYFVAETTLSETTCGETIEVNLIPLSTAIIDSQESNIFTVARSKILRDITDASSTLQICYKDDIENGNITEIIDNEADNNEIKMIESVETVDCTMNNQNHENDNTDNVTNAYVEEITRGNQIEAEQSEYVIQMEPTNSKFLNNHTDINNLDSFGNEDSTISRSNMVSQRSSSYFTGDTTSLTNGLDMEFQKASNNIEEDENVREIDIRTEILESCIDSCLSLLNDRRKANDARLQEEKNPIECADNSNDDITCRYDASSTTKDSERKSEFFFDESRRYRKQLSATPSFIQNIKENSPPIRKANSIKSKPAKVDIKSKSTIISVDRSACTKRSPASDSQLKAKSNFSMIGNNGKYLPTDSTESCTRPSSCNLSRERSRSYISSRRSGSSARSSTASRSEDQLEEKEISQRKPKSETNYSKKQSPLSSPKSFSKSCIPILKSRLDARRDHEQMSRPRSPARGPLTMTGLRRSKIDTSVKNITEVAVPTEGDSSVRKEISQRHSWNTETTKEEIEEEKSTSKASKESTNVRSDTNGDGVAPREQTVIYVNIVQQRDRNVTRILDPEKFLEYAKGETIAQNESDTKLEPGMLPKIVTIVSSVANEPSVNAKDDNGSSNLHISTGTLKSLWSVTIQQKEIEVTAKPSVMDTSTSISDLQEHTTDSSQEHRIFGIPKELTNEEYFYMLKILTQKTNLAYLKEIENLCNSLRPRNVNAE